VRSEKKPDELLQLLSDVVGQISTKMRGDVTRESSEQTVERLMNFLRIVKYKPSADL
jgi:intraflagellar transport protein 81